MAQAEALLHGADTRSLGRTPSESSDAAFGDFIDEVDLLLHSRSIRSTAERMMHKHAVYLSVEFQPAV